MPRMDSQPVADGDSPSSAPHHPHEYDAESISPGVGLPSPDHHHEYDTESIGPGNEPFRAPHHNHLPPADKQAAIAVERNPITSALRHPAAESISDASFSAPHHHHLPPVDKQTATAFEQDPPTSALKKKHKQSTQNRDVSGQPEATARAPHVTFAPTASNRIVLEIDGTRIYQTVLPSLTLYQLSHPIDWKSGGYETMEGLTLNRVAQLPYIESGMVFDRGHRICDIGVIHDEAAYDPIDVYPQALIRSPPWGLHVPLLKFFYESSAKVMGVCEERDPCVQKDKHRNVPALVMAAGVLEAERPESDSEYSYSHGDYKVQWLQCRGDCASALESCELVDQRNGRLKRRYRLSWNASDIRGKKDVDLLVASWCTRVWLEEVFMKVMESKLYEQRLLVHNRRQCIKDLTFKAALWPMRIFWCGYRGRQNTLGHECQTCIRCEK